VVKIPTTIKTKKRERKSTKINQKNTILMSEKISVAPINKGFS